MLKRIFLLSLTLSLVFSLCACIESSYTDAASLRASYEEHSELFLASALDAVECGESVYISSYEYFRPEGVSEEAQGYYVFDVLTEEITELSSEPIRELLDTGLVNSLGVKTEEEICICEFNMGGGRQYYNGVYYAAPDRALFLNNFAVVLTEDGAGFSYSVENMNYYTEKWDDQFYYYVAKTK